MHPGFLLARCPPATTGARPRRRPRLRSSPASLQGCVSAAQRSRPAPRRRSRSARAASARPAASSGTPGRRGGRRRTRPGPRARTRHGTAGAPLAARASVDLDVGPEHVVAPLRRAPGCGASARGHEPGRPRRAPAGRDGGGDADGGELGRHLRPRAWPSTIRPSANSVARSAGSDQYSRTSGRWRRISSAAASRSRASSAYGSRVPSTTAASAIWSGSSGTAIRPA